MDTEHGETIATPTVTLSRDGQESRALIEQGHELLTGSLPRSMRDDRFSGPTPDSMLVVSVTVGDQPVIWLGGTIAPGADNTIDLDAIVDGDRLGSMAGPALDLAFTKASDYLKDSLPAIATINLWGKPSLPWHEEVAELQALEVDRELFQMRCPLPSNAPILPTEPFRKGVDDQELLLVNRRAFAGHRDQGGLDQRDLDRLADQPWFRSDGIRLHRDPSTGRLVGFCWTKIHRSRYEDHVGEIFVIGIDPDYHGRGLGKPMTASGLSWLADQGLDEAMLYVEADNQAALATYHKLGFTVHRVDRSWTTTIT